MWCMVRSGLVHTARPGQIVVELGSHPVPDKKRQIGPLQQKGAVFIDGEVSGTPGMVAARKGVIYLAGDAAACKKAERVVAGFADLCLYFGEFGAASRVKLVNNLLVAINIAATAEAMALGLKAGVDVPLMIKAIADRQRRVDPIRHPRALDGGAPLPAGARSGAGVAALFRHDRRPRRGGRRGDADPRLRRAALRALHAIWASATMMSPGWLTCSARCRALAPIPTRWSRM